jgi:ADP-ribosylglycohydrolase
MRVSPIGLYYQDLERVVEVARASSLLTHGHNAALEGAASAALMVSLALVGAGPQKMYEEIQARCFGRSPDFDHCLAKVPKLIDEPPEEVLVEGALGEGWIAEEAVASALYCVWTHADDYRRAVLTAVNTEGDSDSIAAITGSIMGARLGIDEIPETWRERVENSRYLLELGNRLWETRQASKVK